MARICTLILTSLISVSQASPLQLSDDRPAKNWQNDSYPIGNGRIGATLFGGVQEARLQFTVDSQWTGNENQTGGYHRLPKKPGGDHFGAFESIGTLIFSQESASASTQISNPSLNKTINSTQTVSSSYDDNPATKWCFVHENKPITWQITNPAASEITGYSFTSAEDVPARDPSTWVLEGSDNTKQWKQLDKKTNQKPIDGRNKTVHFKLNKPAKFSYYRIRFTANPKAQHFQVAEIKLDGLSKNEAVKNYRRTLDIGKSIHTTTFSDRGITCKRQAIASFPDKVIAWHFTADKPASISGNFFIRGDHPGQEKSIAKGNSILLSGTLVNGLKYAARATVLPQGGTVSTVDGKIVLKGCDSALVILAADTNYVMDFSKNWRSGEATDRVNTQTNAAMKKNWGSLLSAHLADYAALFDRVKIDLGTTPQDLAEKPTRLRIQNYRTNAKNLPRPCLDHDLEELLFNYGRYLLISCSRPGTLPANLQGNWNNTNNPPWRGDYHTNINLQMNYWLAETTNLSELTTPLFDLLDASIPVYTKHSKAEYGKDVKGFVTRMAVNPFGGGGWNWNIEGTAWLSQHYWTHYLYTGDKTFLKERGYPFLRDVSQFWLPRLKALPDGRLVIPNAWSHEHGPYEDGTAHAQQLIWELFSNTIHAANALGVDSKLVKNLTEKRAKLVGPKLGSWGQLMEWMEEKPKLEKSHHRHTSHLFAVFPGHQLSLSKTPEFAEGARKSLVQRGEVGDSRQSWTWAWRTALWAHLNEPERAHSCIAGLLAYNTLDNLWARCSPYQIDGSLGITNGIAEMLLQSSTDQIHLLPALTKQWHTGSVIGLKAIGGHTISIHWKNGKLTKATIKKGFAPLPSILIQGKKATHDPRITIQ